ncbi:hypothetical protein F5887DRAFT_1286896, partial [Amanita rubescens]
MRGSFATNFSFGDNERSAVAARPAIRIPDQRTFPFMDLPPEIHYRIIAEFIKDLRTSFDDIKALRLVCKRFNAIVKPKVYTSHIKAFQFENFFDEDVLSNVRQLQTLLSSRPNEQLNLATTLFIGKWDWLCGTRNFVAFREVHPIDYIFMNAALTGLYVLLSIMSPRLVVFCAPLRTFAKLRLRVPCALKFNLPNISCVVWDVWLNDPKWIMSRTTKLLQQLPRLNELFLIMDEALEELNHLVNCISKLHNLRKLGFNFYHDFPDRSLFYTPRDPNFNFRINAVGKIIAANPNLTHLELIHSSTQLWVFQHIDLAQMLAYLPADSPLKLEHICFSHTFHNSAALAPYIRTLASVDLGNSSMLYHLRKQSIFPPTVTLRKINQLAIEYLDLHPQIVSLTIYSPCHESLHSAIMRILCRHSKTLTHLGIFSLTLCQCIDQTENELAFLQCANLKQLVLYYHKHDQNWTQKKMEILLPLIANLPNSLTLVVNQIWACEMCSKFCSQSQNPFLRDLASRIVYEPCLCTVP